MFTMGVGIAYTNQRALELFPRTRWLPACMLGLPAEAPQRFFALARASW